MAERTRWRNLHDALAIENERLQAQHTADTAQIGYLETEIRGRDNCIDELKRSLERAKLEGAHALSGALLAAVAGNGGGE